MVAIRLAFLIDKMGSRRRFLCRVIARYERNKKMGMSWYGGAVIDVDDDEGEVRG